METRSGSIFVRWHEQLLASGHVVEGHTHHFDHTTFFTAGLWKVECFGRLYKDDGSAVLDGDGRPLWHKIREVTLRGGAPGAFLLIEADKKHRLELVDGPGAYMCVYSHRGPDGEVVPEYTGWHGAYV